MNNSLQSLRDHRAYVIFLILLIVGWVALSRSGYTEDPIESIRSTLDFYHQTKSGELGVVAPDIATMEAETERSHGLFSEIDWSSYGDLLYDIWFICAVTAFVILIGRPIGWLIKPLTQKRLKQNSRSK